ncbi:MAG: YebC/PmpR family DNA-binding transcriptional regulator [Patescibacteria group bacterium]|nr:YebC/PmpR family DNA-binding transcriptional regulator [Patescibacteria group bacterium]
MHYFADNTIKLEGEDLDKFNRILDALQEDDDVDHVYHNVEE